jgi:hypothetical protein
MRPLLRVDDRASRLREHLRGAAPAGPRLSNGGVRRWVAFPFRVLRAPPWHRYAVDGSQDELGAPAPGWSCRSQAWHR